MSRNINVYGIYKNNKRNMVGLHCPRGAEYPTTRITVIELMDKVNRYLTPHYDKFKRFDIIVSKSTTKTSDDYWPEYRCSVKHVNRKIIDDMIALCNSVVN